MPNSNFIELTLADLDETLNIPVIISTDSIAYAIGDPKTVNYSIIYFKNSPAKLTVKSSFVELKKLLGI